MKIFVYFVFIFFFVFNCSYINAQPKGQTTGYKLPRYVSLQSNKSNLRVGANKDYPKILTYVVKNSQFYSTLRVLLINNDEEEI